MSDCGAHRKEKNKQTKQKPKRSAYTVSNDDCNILTYIYKLMLDLQLLIIIKEKTNEAFFLFENANKVSRPRAQVKHFSKDNSDYRNCFYFC